MAVDGDADIPTATTRGNKLISDLKDGLGPETLVLLEEAARIADRLDRLDAILIGKQRQWMHFRTREDGAVNVVLTGALAEARQQAAVLAGLMRDIRTAKSAGKSGSQLETPKGAGLLGGNNNDDELAPRRRGKATS
jgi:putative sterol carrier protein